jgi:hypothetical protein
MLFSIVDCMVKELAPPAGPCVPPQVRSCVNDMSGNRFVNSAQALAAEVDRTVKELAPPTGPNVPVPPLQFAGL